MELMEARTPSKSPMMKDLMALTTLVTMLLMAFQMVLKMVWMAVRTVLITV